ncbi:MAG: ankyrin repeat domain-containing protein [Gemmatimonadaceae bacterium]
MKRLTLIGALLAPMVLGAQDKAKSVALPRPATAAPATAPVVADAAMKGDIETVRKLIKQGAPVNTAQGDGMTALHWAAERGDIAMANALLAAHANVKTTTRIGDYTPLHIAARNGNGAIVTALLKAGADPKASTMSGSTPLHLAAASGNAEAISALLDHGADPNAREAAWGQTPLVFAAEYDRPAAITALLKHGADPSIRTNVISLQDEAAKEQAATKKRNEILISFEPEKHKKDTVKTPADTIGGGLGGAGAPAFGVAGYGGRGPKGPVPKGPFTPDQIQQAINAGREIMLAPIVPKGPITEFVDTLNGGVAGYAKTVGGMGGMTALHHAAREGNVAAVDALLDGGANINDTSYVDHTTPLLLAAINGQYDTELELIKRGANPNIASHPNMTPLYATINAEWAPKSRFPQPQALQVQKYSYIDVMEALLKAKADPNVRLTQQPWYFAFNNCGNANCGLENIEGTNAFWRAAYALDVPAMKLLVKYGADYNVPSQRTAVAGGRGGRGGGAAAGGARAGRAGAPPDTGAAAAAGNRGAQGGGRGGAPQGPPPPPEIEALAKAAPVGAGVYPIHAATGVGYGNGFAGNSHHHAPDAWMAALRYLVEDLHADVNQRDQQGFTPMHDAAARGDNEMILYLVAHGGDVKAVTKTGKTTVDLANGPVQRVSPIPETIALLEKLGAVNTHRCVSC